MCSLRSEIEKANAQFMTIFKQQDATALSELYSSDCKVLPTGCDVVEGKAGVAKVFQGVMSAGAVTVELKTDEVEPLDANIGLAYERSHYTFYKSDGSVFNHGKYVVIWKKVDGKWLLYTDIFNSNT